MKTWVLPGDAYQYPGDAYHWAFKQVKITYTYVEIWKVMKEKGICFKEVYYR